MKVVGWGAVALLVAGLVVALVVGAWAGGALVFSIGVVFLGAGSLAGDRAVGLAMVVVGLAAVVGVLGHMLTGVGV